MKKYKQLFNEVTAKGNCYEANGKYFMDNSWTDHTLTLVHGIVTGQGKLLGVRYGHCWVEDGSNESCLELL